MISNRAKELIANNEFTNRYNIHVAHDKLDQFEIHFYMNKALEIEDIYVGGVDNDARLSIALSMLNLFKKMGPLSIFDLSFREVESFLRDDNSAPAWEGSLKESAWFDSLKECMIHSLFHSLLMTSGVSLMTWSGLELKDKLLASIDMVSKFNGILSKFNLGKLEFVTCEENEFVVSLLDFKISQSSFAPALNAFLEHIQFCFSNQDIKLVAQ